jgi:3-deoxy-manno-octulosonate cytidylyltransferase (CMP-KDO synthetase)
MRIVGIIPARYASTRFPGKPLHLIAGKPLVQHVVERCRLSRTLADVVVATDDPRIADVACAFCRVEMTRPEHPSGTDRIAEVAARLEADACVNIQGDEPLMDPDVIDAVAGLLRTAEMSTAATPLQEARDLDNPNVVKVVVGVDGHALYFSRSTIPFLRDTSGPDATARLHAFPYLRHLGIYGYRRDALQRIVSWAPSPLEQAEKLEQLRALEHGIRIAVARVDHEGIGVDMPGDVARVEAILAARHGAAAAS